jgi:hypothetical protein
LRGPLPRRPRHTEADGDDETGGDGSDRVVAPSIALDLDPAAFSA